MNTFEKVNLLLSRRGTVVDPSIRPSFRCAPEFLEKESGHSSLLQNILEQNRSKIKFGQITTPEWTEFLLLLEEVIDELEWIPYKYHFYELGCVRMGVPEFLGFKQSQLLYFEDRKTFIEVHPARVYGFLKFKDENTVDVSYFMPRSNYRLDGTRLSDYAW